MLDEGLRKRLEALNRGALPAEPAVSPHFTATLVHPRAAAEVRTPAESPTPPPEPVGRPIPGILRQGDLVENAAGCHLRIRLPVERLWRNGGQLVAARHAELRNRVERRQQQPPAAPAMDSEFAALIAAFPQRTLMLDLETCGLSGAALFLVGLLRVVGGEPTVELLLARDYAEEAAVLASLWQIVGDHDVLVTFNGKAFDWPIVLDRSARHRLTGQRPPWPPLHVDMLHHARRRWKRELPDCRLQTLEQKICRRNRTGDIPGQRIPSAYAEFVRTGFEREMEAILYHNAMDLVTLLDLSLRLAG